MQIAADWLLAHVKDPTLDDYTSRGFVLYLCPVGGALKDQIETFYDASRTQIGWNGAHNSGHAHITLTAQFECPDEHVGRMVQEVSR